MTETPGGSVTVTRLSLLAEFSTSVAMPVCVEEVLVKVWESSPESEVSSSVAENVDAMMMRPDSSSTASSMVRLMVWVSLLLSSSVT